MAMTPSQFKTSWGKVVERIRADAQLHGVPEVADQSLLVVAPRVLLEKSSFPRDAADFLTLAGLPSSAAPFLSFGAVADGPQTLIERYGIHCDSEVEKHRLGSLYVIGSDSAGNPLCIDAANGGAIFMLDHEDGFETRTFVTSGVGSLAKALLTIETMPHSDFVDLLRQFDSRAADPTSFLPVEVSLLASNE
jgi:hypothetical protein